MNERKNKMSQNSGSTDGEQTAAAGGKNGGCFEGRREQNVTAVCPTLAEIVEPAPT